MRIGSSVLRLVFLGLVAGSCLAAEPEKSSSLQPSNLAWLIGDWEGEYALPDGFPDMGPAGAEVVSTNSWRWTLGKSFVSLRIREQIDGKPASTGMEILGRNNDTGRLGHWFFGSRGFHGGGEWSRDGDIWSLKWQSSEPDGKKYEGVGEHIQVDADTYTWQMKDLKENGKEVPDWPKVTYRRIIPEADGTDFWSKYVDLAKGSWQGSGKLGTDNEKLGLTKDDAFSYQLTINPVEKAQSCVCEGAFQVSQRNHTDQVRGVAGWDPAKKEVHWIAFWGGGLIEELFLTRCEGNKLYGAFVVKRSTGKTERSGILLDYSQPDTCVVTFTSGKRKGEILSSWKRQ